MYSDIIITGRNFSITESSQKPQTRECALSTLYRIEKVIRQELKYAGELPKFAQLPQAEMWKELKQRAKSIRDAYLSESREISIFGRIYRELIQNERKIQAIYNSIKNLIIPPPVFDLPDELIQYIFRFLTVKDLGQIARVNKHGTAHAKQAEIQRAREYGFKDIDSVKARNYLRNLFQAIRTLVKEGDLAEEYVIHREKWLFRKVVDSEATLKQIKELNDQEIPELKNKLNQALLHYAHGGDTEKIIALVALNADIETRDQDGRTALALVAYLEKTDAVEFLVEKGAGVNSINVRGNTPLIHAISNPEIIQLLLKSGATETLSQCGHNGNTALHFAAKDGVIETVKLLIEYGADVEIRDKNENTPLIYAAKKGHISIVKLLIEKGANVNSSNVDGFTPLMMAIVCSRSLEMCKLILEKGGAKSINQFTNTGFTALHFASQEKLEEITQLLVTYGADPTLLNA